MSTSKSTDLWGTGRRKRAIARVKMVKGKGVITINDKEVDSKQIKEPLVLVGAADDFDVSIKVSGGGINSQIDASRLGIAKALVENDETNRSTLRKAGLLTRDPREKERKKYGKKKARRSPQWSKR